ncbi:hypothetical protein YC2023_019818 [Brassica napus]
MPMSAHDLKPKKVTSSVPTLHKGAMRSAQTEEVQEKPIPTFLMGSQELQEVCQRSKETLNQQENQESKTCYRCHRRGHFSAVCPSKKLKETSLGEKTEISKISDSLIQSDLLVSNACIMHFSLPKYVNTGPKEQESIEEEPPGETLVMDQNKSQDIRPYMLPKEIDSKGSLLPNPTSTIPGMIQEQDTISKTNLCVHGTGSPSLDHRVQKNNEHSSRDHKVFTYQKKTRSRHQQPLDSRRSRRVPDQNKGVLLSFLLKGGPPGVPSKIKPIKNQGKALESQRRMKPDLLYLGAGYPVSRSKHFQEIGDDIGTETTPEPGANRMHHSANRRTNQDMCSVKTAHLSNQEKFYNETNFNAF